MQLSPLATLPTLIPSQVNNTAPTTSTSSAHITGKPALGSSLVIQMPTYTSSEQIITEPYSVSSQLIQASPTACTSSDPGRDEPALGQIQMVPLPDKGRKITFDNSDI